ALAHGKPEIEARFRARARELDLVDRILQIPFLPHWRVPEFLRSCLAVCCLEQDFPIGFHSPIVPREGLLCGTCLVASAEMIRKLPGHERLPPGYGCVAVRDVHDVEALAGQLAAIAKDPAPAPIVGARGRRFACELQADVIFPEPLELILETAASRGGIPYELRMSVDTEDAEDRTTRFPLTALVAAAIGCGIDRVVGSEATLDRPIDVATAREVLAAVERAGVRSDGRLKSMISAVKIEIAIAEAEEAPDSTTPTRDSTLAGLQNGRWAINEQEFSAAIPFRDPRL